MPPRRRSSGSIGRIGWISKRGAVHRRMFIFHKERFALRRAARRCDSHDRRQRRALRPQADRRHSVAAIGRAGQLARIVGSVRLRRREYREVHRQS